MQWMSVSKKVDTLTTKRERRWWRKTKRCERFTSMRTFIGERTPNDRYDVRSRDCHATDAHVSYGNLSNVTSGGASNFLAQEDLEHFEEAHYWNIQAKFYSVKVPT